MTFVLFHLPQILYVTFAIIGLLVAGSRHGQSMNGLRWSFYTALFKTVFLFGLLFWGGFFN
jgi:hypothetical protein